MTPSPRGAAAIIGDLFALTAEMHSRLDDADFLIEGVDKRQSLAEEFQALKGSGQPMFTSPLEKEQADSLLRQVAEMDRKIASAIETLRDDVKEKLSSSKTKQRVLGYTNAAISGSGSYMDFKK